MDPLSKTPFKGLLICPVTKVILTELMLKALLLLI